MKYQNLEYEFNSHVRGVTIARPYGFEINFVRNPFSGSAWWFFVLILKFIFRPIFEIKIHAKKFLDILKISFSKADFHIWPRQLGI